MEKVGILTASRVEPGVVAIIPRSDIIRLLAPALDFALHFQTIISSLSVFLCTRAWLVSYITLAAALYVSKIVAIQAFVMTRFSALHGGKAVASAWNSKRFQALRDKLWYELAIWVLGSGNTVILMLFWPGWWVLGGTTWALWLLFG